MAVDREAIRERLKDMNLMGLATELARLTDELKVRKDACAEVQVEFDIVRKSLIPEIMMDMGTMSSKVAGVGTLSLKASANCNTLDAPALQKWLIENEFGDFIKPTVNASTLKSFMKEQIEEGSPIPSDEIVRYEPYFTASVVARSKA